MRVLVVDDQSVRQEAFAQRYHGHEVVAALDADAAHAALAGVRFDVICLDFDLGEFSPTGLAVVRHIVSTLPVEKRPDRIVIHTGNPWGATQMEVELRAANIPCDIEPFRV